MLEPACRGATCLLNHKHEVFDADSKASFKIKARLVANLRLLSACWPHT